MNPFDTEFESITHLKELCDQSTTNKELLENLKVLRQRLDLSIEFLHITIKHLQKDAERTDKKISELASIVENRSRGSNSYYRNFHEKKEDR